MTYALRHLSLRFALLTLLCVALLPPAAWGQPKAGREELREYRNDVIDAMHSATHAKMMQMCDSLYNKAASQGDTDAMLDSYFLRVTYLSSHFMIDEAKEELQKLSLLADKIGKYEPLYDAWSNIVVEYYLQKPDHLAAVSEVKAMQAHAVEHSNDYGLGLVYCAMGNCYAYSHSKAIDNYLKGIEYLNRAGVVDMTAYPYCLICQSYGELGQWDKVIEYAQKIKQIERYPSSSAYFADIMLLQAYTHLDNKAEADKYYKMLRQPLMDRELSANTMSILGVVATEYLSKYGELDRVPEFIAMISEPSDSLSAVMVYNEALGDYRGAYEASKKLQEYQNMEMLEVQNTQIENANAHFNTEVHDLEKARLTTRFQRWLLVIVGLALITLIIWVMYLKKMSRKMAQTKQELQDRNHEISLHEEQLRTSEEMKTCFIESMSHEVRTPLHAIKGFSELLLDKTVNEADRREFTMLLRRNVDSLTRILEKMIEMSEIVTNSGQLKAEEVDLARLSRLIVDQARRSNPKAVDIQIDIDKDCVIFSHYYYVSALLSNLVENGLKFTDEGRVVIACHKGADDMVRLTVTDTGIGMPADKMEWVFERFTKIDTFKPGLGVGLFLCRIIATRLGGTIHIDPTYREGCRVVVEIPGFIK